jgi:hypothetical protein
MVLNTELLPELPAKLVPQVAPAPPAPTVTDIGLAGIDNFVPQGNEVL